MSDLHICTSEHMHPYECDGPGKCIHCDATKTQHHDPRRCWLCWDGDPEGPPGACASVNDQGERR